MKVVQNGIPRGQRGQFSKIRLERPSFLQKPETKNSWASQTYALGLGTSTRKMNKLKAELGFSQNTKVLGFFEI